MKIGDLIAFEGAGKISRLIKLFAGSPTHVGIIKEIQYKRRRVILQESTSLDGKAGVVESYLSKRIPTYNGRIWWIPMDMMARVKSFNPFSFEKFLRDTMGTKYDSFGALQTVFHCLFWVPEDFQKLFCSELVTGALEAAGCTSRTNASRKTPKDVLALKTLWQAPLWDMERACEINRVVDYLVETEAVPS